MPSPSKKTTRRSFLTQALFGWISISLLPVLYAIVEYVIPPAILERATSLMNVGKLTDIPRGGAKIVRINKKAIAIVETDQGQIKAYSAVCTHLGCIIQYQADRKLFHCNCHGSEFDLNGNHIAGPAPAPLKPYRTEVKNDDIFVSQA